jgi:D-alanyl-D-alanine carboxypeptidase
MVRPALLAAAAATATGGVLAATWWTRRTTTADPEVNFTSCSDEVSAQAVAEAVRRAAAPFAPGMSFCAVRLAIRDGNEGEDVHEEVETLAEVAIGLRDVGHALPVTPNTRFPVASCTKLITASLAFQMAQDIDGLLEQPSVASKLLAEDEALGVPEVPDLTLAHLLAHTGGVPNPLPTQWLHPAANAADFDETTTLKKVLAELGGSWPKTRPGEVYTYTNLGYWLLGRALCRAGMPAIAKPDTAAFAQLVAERITGPLGLSTEDLGFDVPTPSARMTGGADGIDVATGYVVKWGLLDWLRRVLLPTWLWVGGYERDPAGREWLHLEPAIMFNVAYGGAVGTARALAALGADLLKRGPSAVILRDPAARKALLSEPVQTPSGAEMTVTRGGLVSGTLSGERWYAKPGGGPGFAANVRFYPERGLVTAWVANGALVDAASIAAVSDKIDTTVLVVADG